MATSFHSDQAEKPNLNLLQDPDPDLADSELFDRNQQESDASPPKTFDDRNLTIRMTLLFLILMVLYVGFFVYRWSKTRQSVGNYYDGENRESVDRNLRRQQNQMVLDETISTSTRALQNAEEQAKLEERKMNIKQALALRLIIEEEEVDLEDACLGSKAASAIGEETTGEELPAHSSAVATSAHKRGIFTFATCAPEKTAAAQQTAHAEVEADHDDDKAQSVHPKMDSGIATEKQIMATVSVTTSPSPPSSTVSPPTTTTATTPSSPLRSPLHLMSSLSCGSNASCSSVHGKFKGVHSVGKSNDPCISLAVFTGTYGEECNICLSKFQVGDSAAWSKHHYDAIDSRCDSLVQGAAMPQSKHRVADVVPTDAGHAKLEGVRHACTHVFHEECISRWLLVRDGCPVCRRSYFPNHHVKATDANNSNPSLVDLERGIGLADA